MNDITATLRVTSSDLALTETVERDGTATIRPVTGAGTVPDAEAYLFAVDSEDFARFEAALKRDGTVEEFDRVVEFGSERLYSFRYAPAATLFSPAIAAVNGVSLEWANGGTAWTVRVWLPDRAALAELWEYAAEHDIEVSLERVTDAAAPVDTADGLTRDQRDALRLALEMGYFEEPRESTLSDVATALDISQPAAGGLLRRGIRRLVVSTVGGGSEDE